MNYARIFICCALLLLMAAGCSRSRPVIDLKEQSVGTGLSLAEVETGIKNAGLRLGWKIVTISPGLLEGTFYTQKNSAVVSIPFSKTNYSILYKTSTNLKAQNGTIHKIYNLWVQNLDKEIGLELSRRSIR